MESKIIEVLDRVTYLPVLATRMASEDAAERYHLIETGYGDVFTGADSTLVIITPLEHPERSGYGSEAWGDRTRTNAHRYIERHWDELKTGDVVDVEYVLGEKPQPRQSERLVRRGR